MPETPFRRRGRGDDPADRADAASPRRFPVEHDEGSGRTSPPKRWFTAGAASPSIDADAEADAWGAGGDASSASRSTTAAAAPHADDPHAEPPTARLAPIDEPADEGSWTESPAPHRSGTDRGDANPPRRRTGDGRVVHRPARPPRRPLRGAAATGESGASGAPGAAAAAGTGDAAAAAASTGGAPAPGALSASSASAAAARRRGRRATTSWRSPAEPASQSVRSPRARGSWSGSNRIGRTFPESARFAPTPVSAASAASATSPASAPPPPPSAATPTPAAVPSPAASQSPTPVPRPSPTPAQAPSANSAKTPIADDATAAPPAASAAGESALAAASLAAGAPAPERHRKPLRRREQTDPDRVRGRRAARPEGREPRGAGHVAARERHRAAVRSEAQGHDDAQGLRSTALWSAASTVLPGTGLIPTRRRQTGRILLAVVIALTVLGLGLLAWFTWGSPLPMLLRALSRRGVALALLGVLVVSTLVWLAQILLTAREHTEKNRLQGPRRIAAYVLATMMMALVALPAGQGIHSVWAFQRLLGNESVFGGGAGRLAGPDPWADAGRINVLLLGSDAGADRTGTRPDTIIVASIDTATGKTALFSVPRNLEHPRFPEDTPAAEVFPDGFRYWGPNQDLINSVWTWAYDRPDLFEDVEGEPGLVATTWAVEETLGLEMDYYALVDLQGFQDLVNALGGVNMVVERRVPIGGGAAKIDGWIEPGEQKLDGFHALWYARSREGANDFNRMCRQQRIIREVTEEATPTRLASSVPGLVRATEDNIQTDIPKGDVDAFVTLALRVQDGGITSYPITPEVTNPGDPDWDYLKQWTQASIEDSMTQDAEPEPTTAPDPDTTGADASKAPDSAEEGLASQAESTPTETPSETPTPEETSGAEGSSASPSESASPAPEIDHDPLRSCMPGSDQSEFYQG